MRAHLSRYLALSVSALALAGCAIFPDLQTRPGHPDSWHSYYKSDDAWKTKGCSGDSGKDPVSSTVYSAAQVPCEIWVARGYAQKMAVRYEAAEHQAEDVADELSIPIIGAAGAAVGAAIFNAGTTAISAAGLGGGVLGGANGYLHPEQDATSDRTAARALYCVVDKTSSVKNFNGALLVADELALRYALMDLDRAAGPVLVSNHTDQPTVNAQKAVKTIQASGQATLKALRDEIENYNELVDTIYGTADTIDFNARSSGTRSVSYSDIKQSIQNSAQSASDASTAQTQLSSATASANTVSASVPGGSQLTTGAVSPSAAVVSTAITPPAPPPAAAPQQGAAPPPAAGEPATAPATQPGAAPQGAPPADQTAPADQATTAQASVIDSILGAKGTNVMVKVNQLSDLGLNDLPITSFAVIGTNVSSCANN